jgi:hypothetical protein
MRLWLGLPSIGCHETAAVVAANKTPSKRKKTMTKQQSDIYSRVTQNIITAIEKGAGDWQMPWHQAGTGLNRPKPPEQHQHRQSLSRYQHPEPLGLRSGTRLQHRNMGNLQTMAGERLPSP